MGGAFAMSCKLTCFHFLLVVDCLLAVFHLIKLPPDFQPTLVLLLAVKSFWFN